MDRLAHIGQLCKLCPRSHLEFNILGLPDLEIMLRFYNYIYYRAYCSSLRAFGGSAEAAVWGAYLELYILIGLNVVGLSGLLQFVTGYRVFSAILYAPVWQQGSVLLLFGFWMNRIWGSKEKAGEIAKEFEKLEETKRQKFWRGVGINAYEAGWLIAFILCSLFVH